MDVELATPLEVIQRVFMRGKRPMVTPCSMRWTSAEAETSVDSGETASKSGAKKTALSRGAPTGRQKRQKVEKELESPATPVISRSAVANRARCGPEITLGEWLSSQSSKGS
mmetsp:Transcript_42362/g.91965  ORF Transcript_42362/g.91965 Transcript_42362/m.91965 type:complete len:112 (-) Transcript_42362:75-410(-)